LSGKMITEEEICKLTSAKQVRRTLEELAMTGNYQISRYEDGFIVYTRDNEEITGKKLGDRKYQVVKRVRR